MSPVAALALALAAAVLPRAPLQESAPASAPARIDASALGPFPARDDVVARVAGTDLRLSDLGRGMLFLFGPQARETTAKLASDELVRREASRLGVVVRGADLEAAVEAAMRDVRARVEAESAGKRTLDSFLREELGTSADEYRRELRRFTLARRFLELLLRYDALLEDRAVARVLTTARRRQAEEILGRIREGADFAVLARERSIGAARAAGGRLPPFPRDWDHPIAPIAFRLAPGETAGPVEEKKGEVSLFHLVRLVERIPGRAVSFGQVEEEICAGLAASPVEEFEYSIWHARAARRWKVDLPHRPGS